MPAALPPHPSILFFSPRSAFQRFSIAKPTSLLNCTVSTTQSRSYAKGHRSGRMPPKKNVEEKKILLGRPGNNLKSGIVRYYPSFLHTDHFLTFSLLGWSGKRWKVDSLSSHHQMFARKPCRMLRDLRLNASQ